MTCVFLWGRAVGIGGTERRMGEAITHLSSLGHRVECWFPQGDGGPLQQFAVDSGARVRMQSPIAESRELRRRPDVVVALGLNASIRARSARVVAGLRWPLIDARNGLEMGRGRLVWRADATTQYAVTRYVCNSEAAAEKLREEGICSSRVAVVPSALGQRWHQRADVPRDPDLIMMVGNSRPEKNHLFGLRAVLAADVPGVRVSVYTDDAAPLRRQWKAVPGHEKLQVEFNEGSSVGPRELASAGTLVHPSVSESLPLTVLEALSQGTRVVATDVGDTRSAVGNSGTVVPVNDLQALALALRRSVFLARSGAALPSGPLPTVGEYCRNFFAAGGVRL